MKDEFKVDYDGLEDIAKQLSGLHDEIEQMKTDVSAKLEDLRDGWVGRGSDSFFAEMEDEILPALERMINAMEEGSTTCNKIVSTVEAAEQKAKALFGVR